MLVILAQLLIFSNIIFSIVGWYFDKLHFSSPCQGLSFLGVEFIAREHPNTELWFQATIVVLDTKHYIEVKNSP